MKKEIRAVPREGWKHPVDENNNFIPLCDGNKYTEHLIKWEKETQSFSSNTDNDIEDWTKWANANPPPFKKNYTNFLHDNCHGLQVYEIETRGTPISPVFFNREELIEHLLQDEKSSDIYPDKQDVPDWHLKFGERGRQIFENNT